MEKKEAKVPPSGGRIILWAAACCIAAVFCLTGCLAEETGTGKDGAQDEAVEENRGSVSQDARGSMAEVAQDSPNAAAEELIGFPTDAWEMSERMGIGINLGNTMEAFWEDTADLTGGAQTIGSDTPACYETCWGAAETTREMIYGMKEAGFSTLRIPVYWGNMMEDDGTFTVNREYLDRVAELVSYGLDADMCVVINIHHYDQFLIEHYPQERVLEITGALWGQIAGYFREYPEELVFEGFNEALGMTGPEGQLDAEKMYAFVNGMNQTFVDAVRGTGGGNASRVLIVSGYQTNIDATTDERFRMPEDTADNRLMVSVHYIDNLCYWTNSVGNAAWMEYSRNQCELLKERFLDRGIPVFVGECTAAYPPERLAQDAEVRTSQDCLGTILGMIGEYGMTPVLWDTCDQFFLRSAQRVALGEDQAVIDAYRMQWDD